jgi:F-type H+-transporting ATPase subunit gamma
MASIKEYNEKIKSLRNTRKITKTMKMVSASKLRRAQEARNFAKAYAEKITELTSRIAASSSLAANPLIKGNPQVQKALILVFTSDRGLCGAFNLNALRSVTSWLNQNQKNYSKIELSFCGKRGFNFFKKLQNIRTFYENVTGKPKFSDGEKIGADIIAAYLKQEYTEVYMAISSAH